MSEIPKHCPYKAGDRVQLHGYAGAHVHSGQSLKDHDVIGFRGVVEGYVGGTILTGTTDGGREWVQEWGGLSRDLTPCGRDGRCACCPHPGRAMINGCLHFGKCQPEQSSAARARQNALEMADWWRNRAGRPRSEDPVERAHALGLLFDVGVAR